MVDLHKNLDDLRQFIKQNQLIKNNSEIHFSAVININTNKNVIVNDEYSIRINMNGYNPGEVTIHDSNLDPFFYPTVFNARFQKMNLITNQLVITGEHKSNSNIGKYKVEIIPLI